VDGGPLATGTLANSVLDQSKPSLSGETYLYGVKDGAHYLAITAAGEWSVTLTPIS
jgi:hypothetical protein